MRSEDLDPSRPAPRRGGLRRGRARDMGAAVSALVLGAGCLVGWAPMAHAVGSVSASPNSGLSDGGSVSVSVVVPATTPGNVFIGVTQCGNASGSGVQLTSLATDGSDCMGVAGLGSSLVLIGAGGAATPAGPVTAGTYHVTLKLKETGIGTAGAKCVASPPATLPCTIVASTATVAGPYASGDGAFQASTPITYADTSSSSSTTTTTTRSGGASTTTTTVARTAGSTTTAVRSSSGSTTTTTVGAALAASSGTPSSGTAAGSSGSLANTGTPKLVWLLGVIGLVLVDLGYLSLSATWRGRRARRPSGG